ncbi:MAG: VTT domain-containing protein [Campylobacterales bacterium]|nr:VTT domain-containing protein [Campylobacterales bacterium]
MGSEALLIYDLEQGFDPFFLIFFASVGNILGSGINYWFGLKGEEYLEKKKIIKPHQVKKSKKFFNKYGGFSLLFAWVPFLGDPITFAAGVLRYDMRRFFLFVTIGKVGRYMFLYFGWLSII